MKVLSDEDGDTIWNDVVDDSNTRNDNTAPTNRDSRNDRTTLSAIVKEYTGHTRQDFISAIMKWHEGAVQNEHPQQEARLDCTAYLNGRKRGER
jgi:hypothetical protein